MIPKYAHFCNALYNGDSFVIFGQETLISLYTFGIHCHKRPHTSRKNFHSDIGRGFATSFFLTGFTEIIGESIFIITCDHVIVLPDNSDPLFAVTVLEIPKSKIDHTIAKYFL
jgi:hypothetical protein